MQPKHLWMEIYSIRCLYEKRAIERPIFSDLFLHLKKLKGSELSIK